MNYSDFRNTNTTSHRNNTCLAVIQSAGLSSCWLNNMKLDTKHGQICLR